MQASDTFWHIANFFAPALFVGLLAAAATKAIWRRELAGVGWLRLAAWAGSAMAVVSIAGLVIFEHDGKMITYAAMLLACAAGLWWAGFRRGGR
jgi:hypothetical protein